jgi:hypothetical protein
MFWFDDVEFIINMNCIDIICSSKISILKIMDYSKLFFYKKDLLNERELDLKGKLIKNNFLTL